jgi:hypothetical protein
MANISATQPAFAGVEVGERLGYDPRCLKHDISNTLGQNWATDNYTVELLTDPRYQTFGGFLAQLDNTGNETQPHFPIHVYGHFAMNGDPAGDVNTPRLCLSPSTLLKVNDPSSSTIHLTNRCSGCTMLISIAFGGSGKINNLLSEHSKFREH